MAKYLDENGVPVLWERIKEYINQCGGGGGGSCNCPSMTEAQILAMTPIDCDCPEESYGTFVEELTATLSPTPD